MKSLSFVLSLSLLLSACSETVREISYVRETRPQDPVVNSSKSSKDSDLDKLRLLLSSEAPNIALAELLAKTLPADQRAEVSKIISELSAEEASSIIKQVTEENQGIRNTYLFHGQSYQNNVGEAGLLAHVYLSPEESRGQFLSMSEQLQISTFSYIKSKSLEEIVSTYEKRANELGNIIAAQVAFDIGTNHPELAQKIEDSMQLLLKPEVVELIQKAMPQLEEVDRLFKGSSLSDNEQYTVLLMGAIAGGVYMQVKDHKSFKKIIEEGVKVYRDVKDLYAKVNEFATLVSTLEKHSNETNRNLQDMESGIKGSREDIMAMFKDAKAAINDPKSSKHVESKEIFRFLKGAVLGEKKKSGQPENSSILSKKIRINANLDKSVKAVGNLSNNLSNIIQTTEAMAALFKTDLPPGMKKLMGKAQKVSAMVNLATTAIAAFSTGGFMGAMSVMGSMGSMFGGGGKGQDSAMLAEINQKLDAVLENQKKIMELQIETMNMIKELAVMVDQYHQREMLALAELRDSSLVVNEISKSLLNRDVRACERMVNYQLSSIWKNFDFSKEAFFSINHLGLIQSRFTSTITSLGDIRRILGSVEDDGFRSCQRGLAEAFGGNASEENPLRAIFDSTGEKNLMKFQREIYHPLLSGLKEFSQVTDFDSLPLHLPVKTFAGLRHKIDYLNSATLVKHSSNDIYDLENLISVKNLERYLSHLIILLPVIEVNGATWSRSTSEIISEYLEMANTGSNQNTRSNYFLRNALKLTQSAIAQEALLAGEPILHMIHDKKIREVLSASNCASDGREDSLSLVCSVRKNKLLLKNLLAYTLHFENKNNAILQQYRVAYSAANPNLPELARLFNAALSPESLKVSDSGITLSLRDHENKTVTVGLPTPDELEEGKILYSENMERLLMMQKVILDNLEKVSPVKRNNQGSDLIKLLLVGAA